MRSCSFAAGLALLLLAADPVAAQASQGIVVINGQFGTLGVARKLDIVQRLNQLCGGSSRRCEAFCSETSFGRYQLGRHPICRVTYRCPGGEVKATEAAREELILLHCLDEEAEMQPVGEQRQPPPYVPSLKQ